MSNRAFRDVLSRQFGPYRMPTLIVLWGWEFLTNWNNFRSFRLGWRKSKFHSMRQGIVKAS